MKPTLDSSPRLVAACVSPLNLPHLRCADSNPEPVRADSRRLLRETGAALLLGLACLLLGALPTAQATTITVANLNDSGPGSLRQAIADAAPGDTIDFAVTGTIALTTGELLVTNNLTILGPGPGNLAVDGNAASRVFHITNAVTVAISSLTVTDGVGAPAIFNSSLVIGGGIYNDHATLTVSNCTVNGNSAEDGGGIYNDHAMLTVSKSTISGNLNYGGTLGGAGGGIFNNGSGGSATLTVSDSTLSDNSAGAGQGGGIYNSLGMLTVTNCTVNGNSASTGGGIRNDGQSGSATLIYNSTFSHNSAGSAGGGIFNIGQSGSATLTVSNCTFSDNSAVVLGGGIFNNGESGSVTLTVSASTFSGNSTFYGFDGSGIFNDSATLEIGNTILNAGASGANVGTLGGTVTSDGYNLSSDAAGGDDHSTGPGGLLNATGDIRNTDPMLGPLADNGGPTFTHALLPGSPAIDHGKSFGLTTDQRGFSRLVDDACIANAAGGDGSDIGAFEVQSVCQPVDFRITAIKQIGSSEDLRLSYTTVLGSNYVVQTTSNLVSGSWTSLPGTNVGIGVVMQSIVTNALAAPQGFYRAQQLP